MPRSVILDFPIHERFIGLLEQPMEYFDEPYLRFPVLKREGKRWFLTYHGIENGQGGTGPFVNMGEAVEFYATGGR